MRWNAGRRSEMAFRPWKRMSARQPSCIRYVNRNVKIRPITKITPDIQRAAIARPDRSKEVPHFRKAVRAKAVDIEPKMNGMLQKTSGASHGAAEGPSYGKVSNMAKLAKGALSARLNGATIASTRLATALAASPGGGPWP